MQNDAVLPKPNQSISFAEQDVCKSQNTKPQSCLKISKEVCNSPNTKPFFPEVNYVKVNLSINITAWYILYTEFTLHRCTVFDHLLHPECTVCMTITPFAKRALRYITSGVYVTIILQPRKTGFFPCCQTVLHIVRSKKRHK